MKKIIFVSAVVIAAFLFFRSSASDFFSESNQENLPPEQTTWVLTPTPSPSAGATQNNAPKEINLAVPFSAQAPFGDWGLPYQEACEETSAILVNKFFKGENLTPEKAKEEIDRLVAWQKREFGYYMHTTAEETAKILREFFGYKKVVVETNVTRESISAHLYAGRPVILPLAGRMLGNPYYRQPGPVYHMLVVKGITADGRFITNDVGTKRGQNYIYSASVLLNAVHDAPTGGDGWDVGNPEQYVLSGRKAMIVVYP